MKLQCQRDGLLMACQLVSAALPARTTHAILTNVKAVAEDDRLTLAATDLEVGIRYQLRGVQVTEAGDAVFPAQKLVSILRESLDEEVDIDANENRCLVTTPSSEFEMPGDNPDDFPAFPEFEEAASHELTAGLLRTMIRQTVFAAAREDQKYTMTGVLWEVEGKAVRLVATDSKRLALYEGEGIFHGEGEAKTQSSLVPTKAMNLLERNLNDDGEIIKISMRLNDVLFQTEKATIYSRLVEGRYPPYRDIIPKKMNARIQLPVEGFLARVRQAAVMTDDESKRVAFHFGPGQLTLQAQGAATGRSKVSMPIAYEGPEININFDPQFLVEMLRVLEDQTEVTLDLVDGVRPALFRVGETYLYLVMPLS